MDTLGQLDIALLETPPPNLSYIFKHIITRDVAYNLMLYAQRQMLHRVIVEWYEETHQVELYSTLVKIALFFYDGSLVCPILTLG